MNDFIFFIITDGSLRVFISRSNAAFFLIFIIPIFYNFIANLKILVFCFELKAKKRIY